MRKKLNQKFMKFWDDNSGFGEFVSPLIKSIVTIAGCAIVLGILYTSIKVLAAKTATTVINIMP